MIASISLHPPRPPLLSSRESGGGHAGAIKQVIRSSSELAIEQSINILENVGRNLRTSSDWCRWRNSCFQKHRNEVKDNACT
mmetsp:Transcript_42733/g.62565  ORF Transcript_42733/g.62565 Transcript_42733/m.62565 type:complete len:82 (-) Transcript_42733:210-455(-)